jgi:hypothetical protein
MLRTVPSCFEPENENKIVKVFFIVSLMTAKNMIAL